MLRLVAVTMLCANASTTPRVFTPRRAAAYVAYVSYLHFDDWE